MELIGEQLRCERGGREVFAGLSFQARAGAMVVLRGPNGAGKSSLLRMIAGLIEPAAGSLKLAGGHKDLTTGQQCHLIAHADALKPALSVAENLRFWANFLGASAGNLDEALGALSLDGLRNVQAGLLSAGQKRRVALTRLVLTPRVVWLLDEPTVGLDAGSQSRLIDMMQRHMANSGVIVAATHVDLGLCAGATVDFAELADGS